MVEIELMSTDVIDSSSLKTYGGLVISDPIVGVADEKTFLTVYILTQGNKIKYTIQFNDCFNLESIKMSLNRGNLVDYKMSDRSLFIPDDPAKTFNMILAKEDPAAKKINILLGKDEPIVKDQFVSMKYGPELSPYNGEAGNMVAAGWVYAKTTDTITVGDGRVVDKDIEGKLLPKPIKRYEETYNVDPNVTVYNVNIVDYSNSSVSDFNSIPITKDYDYTTTDRQAVYLVFDKNYKQSETAKVTSIYFLTPHIKTDGKPVWDVPEKSDLLKNKGIDPISGKPFDQISATYPHIASYTRSTEPFEVVRNTCYYVGDNEVAMYLLNADMGTVDKSDDKLILFDAGWPNSGYQYWKNIEAVGYDPRKITDIMLTHGHFDHYGTALELIKMIENAGGKVILWGSGYDTFGIKEDAMGNKWDIKGSLPDFEEEIRSRTIPYEMDKFYDFGNIKMLVTYTPGHSVGATSFVFNIKNPDTDEFMSFCYQGGFGYPTFKDAGYLRLAFAEGLAYLEQKYGDVDYVMPQHTNQYPWVEIYQAVKAYNNDPKSAGKPKTFLEALNKGELINFAERRYQVATNKISDIKSRGDMNYTSIETDGPYKPGRENGLSQVKVKLLDGGIAFHGFNKYMNKNQEIPLLKDGIVIERDSWTEDPEGWYVQFFIKVFDDYKGYIPEPKDKSYKGGPIETVRSIQGAPEVLRTQRLNSKVEADEILATVKAGESYYVDLTKSSMIIVPDRIKDTFRKV